MNMMGHKHIPTNKVLGEVLEAVDHPARVNVTDFKEVVGSTLY